MDDFKRFFLRGLGALLPTLLTIALLIWAYEFVNRHIGRHITEGMIHLLAYAGEPTIVQESDLLRYGTKVNEWFPSGKHEAKQLTVEYKIINSKALKSGSEAVRKRAERARKLALWHIAFAKYKLHVVGFVIAVIVVYFVGFFLASFIGRTTWKLVEGLILRIPLVRAIYPNIKQVTDFLFTDRQFEFSGVVAVQYPRKGIWSVGLLTGQAMKFLKDQEGPELLTVFIPSSPTPMTGYTIMVPKSDMVLLDLSIDEALRFTISGGVITPGTAGVGASDAAPLPKRAAGT